MIESLIRFGPVLAEAAQTAAEEAQAAAEEEAAANAAE